MFCGQNGSKLLLSSQTLRNHKGSGCQGKMPQKFQLEMAKRRYKTRYPCYVGNDDIWNISNTNKLVQQQSESHLLHIPGNPLRKWSSAGIINLWNAFTKRVVIVGHWIWGAEIIKSNVNWICRNQKGNKRWPLD